MTDLNLDPERARDLWAILGETGRAPQDMPEALSAYSVGIDPWIERLAISYLRDRSRRQPHFKLVIGVYGGGKTHFLLALANRARAEHFAVAYFPCRPTVSIADPLPLYAEIVKSLVLPDEAQPGLGALIQRVLRYKKQQIHEAGVPDPSAALEAWLTNLRGTEWPEPAFGRVMTEALRAHEAADVSPVGAAAIRWLKGSEVDTLTRDEMFALRLARVPKTARHELGRNLLTSLLRFVPEAGAHGTVLLLDEVETLFTARGKALQRVLGAMRVLIELPGRPPVFGAFAAVPDIIQDIRRYGALDQRLGCGSDAGHFSGDRVQEAAIPAPEGGEVACPRS